MDNPILQRRQLISQNATAQFSKGEDIEIIDESALHGLVTFDERAVDQLVNDLYKAESTGYFAGQKVTKDEIQKAKEQAQKLEKKVVKEKSGGTKTVYVKVVDQTKPHHKMTHDELMEHHSSDELHQIADNYKVNHDNIAKDVEKNGAADDPYKSQKATNKRGDVASSEEAYMHIKQAAYKKEKLEGKVSGKAVKEANKGYDPNAPKDDVKKGEEDEFEKAEGFETPKPQLHRKQIVDKNGHKKVVYVRELDTEEHHFAVGHKVHFQHKDGSMKTGDISAMKYHPKYDKYGTATIRDEEGNEHSRSLLKVDNHKDNDFKYDTSKTDDSPKKTEKSNAGEGKSVTKHSDGSVTKMVAAPGGGYHEVDAKTGKSKETLEREAKSTKNDEKDTSLSDLGISTEAGTFSIGGKKVTINPTSGYVHLDGKGKAVDMHVGAQYSAGVDKNQLQGITYVHTAQKFLNMAKEGKSWSDIDETLSNYKGVMSSYEPGQAWTKVKTYLGLDNVKTPKPAKEVTKSTKDKKGDQPSSDESQHKVGDSVKIPNNLTTDPNKKQGQTGKITKVEKDAVHVNFDDNTTGKYNHDSVEKHTAEDTKPKLLTGTEAINKKNKDLKAVEEQLKNHDSGVKKLSAEEVTQLKEKKQIIAKTIHQLESKLNIEKALSFLLGGDTFEK